MLRECWSLPIGSTLNVPNLCHRRKGTEKGLRLRRDIDLDAQEYAGRPVSRAAAFQNELGVDPASDDGGASGCAIRLQLSRQAPAEVLSQGVCRVAHVQAEG